MATIKVDPSNLEAAINQIVEEYFDDVCDDADRAVASVAAETVADLQTSSPGNGKYGKSWKVKQTKKLKRANAVEIYNTKYMLTHVLEHGHVLVSHGKVRGFVGAKVHIAPAEQKAIRKLTSEVERAIKQ